MFPRKVRRAQALLNPPRLVRRPRVRRGLRRLALKITNLLLSVCAKKSSGRIVNLLLSNSAHRSNEKRRSVRPVSLTLPRIWRARAALPLRLPPRPAMRNWPHRSRSLRSLVQMLIWKKFSEEWRFYGKRGDTEEDS